MRGNRKRDTRPEMAVRRLLHARGLRYRVHYPILAGGKRIRPDIVFTRRKLAVFIDGCFWHSCPQHGNHPKVNTGYWGPKLERNVSRDRTTNEELRGAGWRVLRIWEHVQPEEAAARIAASWREPASSTNGDGGSDVA
ncbi:MAG: very short patch repair protein [Gemmatimonadetes bacterium]|nr:very short patch repair protein [Gemmatimonadota bacterium]